MASTPPGPPSGPPPSRGVQPMMEDFIEDEADETNVNQIPAPYAQATPRPQPQLHHSPPQVPQPQPFAAASPQLSAPPSPYGAMPGPPMSQVSGVIAQPTPYVSRSRIYAFVVDEMGLPIELGSGRFAKAYLGEERWVES